MLEVLEISSVGLAYGTICSLLYCNSCQVLAVILSGIQRCGSQQSDSVPSMVEDGVCGNDSIVQKNT